MFHQGDANRRDVEEGGEAKQISLQVPMPLPILCALSTPFCRPPIHCFMYCFSQDIGSIPLPTVSYTLLWCKLLTILSSGILLTCPYHLRTLLFNHSTTRKFTFFLLQPFQTFRMFPSDSLFLSPLIQLLPSDNAYPLPLLYIVWVHSTSIPNSHKLALAQLHFKSLFTSILVFLLYRTLPSSRASLVPCITLSLVSLSIVPCLHNAVPKYLNTVTLSNTTSFSSILVFLHCILLQNLSCYIQYNCPSLYDVSLYDISHLQSLYINTLKSLYIWLILLLKSLRLGR